VAVGPGGIWVIETKTWRIGKVRADRKKNVVKFDGARILWPWWDDTKSVKQAVYNAKWIEEWLQKLTEKEFNVSVLIAIPGYEVEVTGKGGVRVEDPQDIPESLIGYGKTLLSPEDIKTIRLQLAEKCRDVEY